MPSLAQLRAGKTQEPQLGFAFDAPEDPPAPAPAKRTAYSVAELVASIRSDIEKNYPNLAVFGEVSNCRPASSGHIYFTLKDGEAQLPVVLFRRQAQALRFKIEDGLEVLVRGKLSVYESRGQLQLIADTLEPRGAGALQLAFEQLKARLQAEGLFDADRKRPLPAFPSTIGIVTSPAGAVIRDIVTVVRRRHACLHLLVYPAAVQGPQSAAEVAAGIRYFNEGAHRPEIILLARGGGSLEDLASFNDEALARAIAASGIPVVSAIGHETDFTIADFVADLRAPTPSAAAELITTAQHRIEERVHDLTHRVVRAMRYGLLQAHQRFNRTNAAAVLSRVEDSINRRHQLLDELQYRASTSIRHCLQSNERRLQQLTARLAAQDLTRRLTMAQSRCAALEARLQAAQQRNLSNRQARLATITARLQGLSPLAVLERGYALVYDEQGKLLRNPAETEVGASITTRLHGGALTSTVTKAT